MRSINPIKSDPIKCRVWQCRLLADVKAAGMYLCSGHNKKYELIWHAFVNNEIDYAEDEIDYPKGGFSYNVEVVYNE